MTSKERMGLAMNLDIPDRVPLMCQMSIGHMLLQSGLPPSEFWHSAEVFAEGLLALRELYAFDGILASLHGHDPGWRKSVVRLTRGSDGEKIDWRDGSSTLYPPDDLPIPISGRTGENLVFQDFDPETIGERIGFIPVSQGLRFFLDEEHLFGIFDILNAATGKALSIHGEVTSPFDYFLDLFGFEQALTGLVDDPGKSREILERLTRGIIRLAVGQAENGADAVKISSPFSGGGFLSPDQYRQFVLPFESQICRAVRGRGVHAYLHTCGKIGDRLELMAGSGASGIECLDPPPLGNVDLDDAKRRVGRLVFIKGNIDPVNTLLSGHPKAVADDTRRKILAGKPGGGFILSTACSIAPRTPRRNVRALLPVVEIYGRYP